MKLDNVDIIAEDIQTINKRERFNKTIDYEDVKLSHDVPIVVRYDYIDLDKTPYHFNQEFTLEDTQGYFARMRKFAGKIINELVSSARDYHFYRSELKGKLKAQVKAILPGAIDSNQIVYHFSLYDTGRMADRKTGQRNSRVYFMLGTYGHIYILFFDPYHELNPIDFKRI